MYMYRSLVWLPFLLSSLTLCFTRVEHSYKESKKSVVVKQPYEPLDIIDIRSPNPNPSVVNEEFDWTYERLRDSLSDFNNGFFEYADQLSSHIRGNFIFKSKFLKCRSEVNEKELGKRQNLQDKVKLQEAIEDLQAKYDSLERALEKVEDINEDNKESIGRLRAHRDRCVQNHATRKKTIDSLRDEATELRRQISHARSQSGN